MELSRQALIDRIQSKVTTIEDFNYDKLVAPPLAMLLTQQDIDNLYYIATSVKYSGKPKKKYEAIDAIMKARGFIKCSAGTNRVVYRHLESNDFVVKVAADAIGIKDNPREFQNQFIFKPFVTKVFEVSPCGTVGLFERVNPIESREEFLSVADDIYDVITEWFIGKYIMADIGSKFFMNWGIRTYSVGREGSVSFGPVLLDFPYVYELDGNKLFCSAVDHNNLETGICGGVIDYDDGFNFLRCSKCGVRYRVGELAKKIKNNEIKVNRRRETKTMIIGRYDKDGNIVVDDQVVTKPEEKKVKSSDNQPTLPVGTLTIDMSLWKNKQVNKPVEEAPKRNNSLRTNPANSRGIVKAPASSDIKVEMPTNKAEEQPKDNSPKSFDGYFDSYEAEYDLLTIKFDGDNTLRVKLGDIVPDDYKQSLVENSSEYTEYLSMSKTFEALQKDLDNTKLNYEAAMKDVESYKMQAEEKSEEVKTLKSTIKNMKEESGNGTEEIDKLNQAIADKDSKIANLQEDIDHYKTGLELATKTAEDVSSSYDDMIKAKDDKIAELNKLVEELNDKIAVASDTKGGIPRKVNPNPQEINPDYYCNNNDAILIDGFVEDINGFASPKIPNRRNVIVFPLDPENADYMADDSGNIIALAQINGYFIDDLLAKMEESENNTETEEVQEESTKDEDVLE